MHKYIPVCLLPLLFAAIPASAQQLSPEVFRTLVVETVLPFSVRQYSPAFVLPQGGPADALDFSSPEKAIASFFRTLEAGDYALNERCWTRASVAFNTQKNSESGKGPDYWTDYWRRAYRGRKVELLHRIDYENYVLIEYRVSMPEGGRVLETDTLALEQEDGKWLLTQSLADNPIHLAWKAPGSRIQVGPKTVGRLTRPVKQ
ncbi:hypothetical protein [Methyloversatilis sp.]|uniref:hypothetical protein n=1 Tax=Methyloversatilis sp. TaxID=2569862 RepID=UPI0035AF9AE2